MNLEQLRYISEVTQCKSISKAAKRLFLTQPTLSSAINHFEEEVGYKVFKRSNQGVELTEEGMKAMESIGIILHEIQNLQTSNKSADFITGDVYVDAFPTICSTIMPKVIIACKRTYPGITIHVNQTFPEKSVTSLLSGVSNISVTAFMGVKQLHALQRSLGAKNFLAEQLLEEPFVLYTSKSCPLAQQEKATLEDAYGYAWIIFQEHTYDESCMFWGDDEICPNEIISFQDKDSVKQAIAADLGVAVMASSFAGEDDPYVTSGLIHRISLKDVALKTIHVLITPKKRKFTTVEACFLEQLHQFYQQL